jgi:hypothetical protein
MDYLYLGSNEDLAPYVLVIQDSFSMYARIHPCDSINAEEACRHILSWILLFGPMQVLTSDQGTQFTSQLLDDLSKNYQFRHHIGSVDVHHNMGAIERANRQILELFRTIMSELEVPFASWTSVYDIVQFAMNNRNSRRLNNNTPLTSFTQLPSKKGFLELLFQHQIKITTDEKWIAIFNQRLDELHQALAETLQCVNKIKKKQKDVSNAARARERGVRPINFKVGDWVYVVKQQNQIKSKLERGAFGPCQIIAQLDPKSVYRWIVKDVLTGKEYEVHVERMIEFAQDMTEEDLMNDTTLKNHLARNAKGFEVDKFIAHKLHDNILKLHTKWKGFSYQHNTWESIEKLMEDVPLMVKAYLKKHSRDKQIRKWRNLQ